jgi:hypothetical protein
LAFACDVVLPTFAKGVILRRGGVLRWLEQFELEERALRRMARLRERYGQGPLLLAVPFRPQVVILSPTQALDVLKRTPNPFSPATLEKRSALDHFEPATSLTSTGRGREARRALNDAALESGKSVHRSAAAMMNVIGEEIGLLFGSSAKTLDWPSFRIAWSRIVRRITLGDRASDDDELTDALVRLRSRANWAFLATKDRRQLESFQRRLGGYLLSPETGSLVAALMTLSPKPEDEPVAQVTQWLFAFDAAGIATFRTLALLLAHPCLLERAEIETKGRQQPQWPDLPFLQAAVRECLRLWPTTPAILRETVAPVELAEAALPSGSDVLIYTPFFHRDEQTVPNAHRFVPGRWLKQEADSSAAIIPFSFGPGQCPGHNLVPMLAAATVNALLNGAELALEPGGRLTDLTRLPATLDHTSLRFSFRRGVAKGSPAT